MDNIKNTTLLQKKFFKKFIRFYNSLIIEIFHFIKEIFNKITFDDENIFKTFDIIFRLSKNDNIFNENNYDNFVEKTIIKFPNLESFLLKLKKFLILFKYQNFFLKKKFESNEIGFYDKNKNLNNFYKDNEDERNELMDIFEDMFTISLDILSFYIFFNINSHLSLNYKFDAEIKKNIHEKLKPKKNYKILKFLDEYILEIFYKIKPPKNQIPPLQNFLNYFLIFRNFYKFIFKNNKLFNYLEENKNIDIDINIKKFKKKFQKKYKLFTELKIFKRLIKNYLNIDLSLKKLKKIAHILNKEINKKKYLKI